MREVKSTIYITDDGKEFANKKEAEIHESKIKNVKCFLVRYAPDLTEGRGFQKSGVVMVHANGHHKDFVEHWCYEKFGNRIDFCMGVYGSNAITSTWFIKEATEKDIEDHPTLHKIEERFVKKIWS
ncbi:hypothetical protein GCM10023310_69480 [Paenibacillus vulneris]|uniref:Uncharacterized protein n=1 Tax=Paenibacillus vulneris TaxID=1133364 RepID=A0ABW3UFE9_9BACL